jgi:hypothetical protein
MEMRSRHLLRSDLPRADELDRSVDVDPRRNPYEAEALDGEVGLPGVDALGLDLDRGGSGRL